MLLPYMNSGVVEAGCDEAGRGCLAGAVYAAAVILPPDFRNELLNDSKQLSVAKTYRDDYMNELHEKYPMYDWKSNKGYPTKAHRAAIAHYGPSPYHRLSFQLLERQLSIF